MTTPSTCSKCESKVKAKGLCSSHYMTQYMTERVQSGRTPRSYGGDPTNRFWQKVNKQGPSHDNYITGEPLAPCWDWDSGLNRLGYGLFKLHPKNVSAHRFSFELLRTEDISELELDHLCKNRKCVNPEHLDPVTHQEHMRRQAEEVFNRPLCINGHDWQSEGTYFFTPSGGRKCWVCRRITLDKYNRKSKS